MKHFSLWFIITVPIVTHAQQKEKTTDSAWRNIIPEWIDTTGMFGSRYGRVARLKQDNMPCIMPLQKNKPIPNSLKGKKIPSDIPNIWKKDSTKGRTYKKKAL